MRGEVNLPGFEEELRLIAREEIAAAANRRGGWLNVGAAADYLSSTPSAIRSLVKRGEIPVHRAPTGRLLFDRRELDKWVLNDEAA